MAELELVILRGLPGSGKSTYAKSLVDKNESYCHVESDMFHVVSGEYVFKRENLKHAHKWCEAKTAFLLNRGVSVVVSNTFTTKEEIGPYIEMADLYNAKTTIVEMKNDYGSIHNVPQEIISEMKNRWEEL